VPPPSYVSVFGWVVGHDYSNSVGQIEFGLSVCGLGWIGSKKMETQD